MQEHQSASVFNKLIDAGFLRRRKHFALAGVKNEHIALSQLRAGWKLRPTLHEDAAFLQQLGPIAQELGEVMRAGS